MADTIVKPNQGEQLDVLGDRVRILATADQTGGAFGAIEVTVSPGGGAPLHVNNRESLGWYVAEGSLQFTTNGEVAELDAGSWFYAPAGSVHTFHNATDRPARALMLAAPGGFEAMFIEVGRTLDEGEVTRPPSEDDIGRLMNTAPSYGVDIFAPAD